MVVIEAGADVVVAVVVGLLGSLVGEMLLVDGVGELLQSLLLLFSSKFNDGVT